MIFCFLLFGVKYPFEYEKVGEDMIVLRNSSTKEIKLVNL